MKRKLKKLAVLFIILFLIAGYVVTIVRNMNFDESITSSQIVEEKENLASSTGETTNIGLTSYIRSNFWYYWKNGYTNYNLYCAQKGGSLNYNRKWYILWIYI